MLDRNDNAPLFSDEPYSFSVRETESVGQTVYTDIKVLHRADGENYTLLLLYRCGTGTWERTPGCRSAACRRNPLRTPVRHSTSPPPVSTPGSISVGVTLAWLVGFFKSYVAGLVVLKKPLNYEDRSSYTLVVEARDAGVEGALTATADLLVRVEDVQDQDPVFLNAPYSATVPEGSVVYCSCARY